jgi:hypothetical protein
MQKVILKDKANIAIINRGEAALRFIKAVKEYNSLHGTKLKTTAFYIEAEEEAPFVKMADDLVDSIPGVGFTSDTIVQAPSEIDGENRVVVSGDDFAFSLISQDCSNGGSVSVDGVSTDGGIVTFHNCNQDNVILNGTAELGGGGGEYNARFTDFSATFSTGTLYLSDAGLTVTKRTFELAIAIGSATIQGIDIGVSNLYINKNDNGTIVNGAIATGCICCEWIDVATSEPLAFKSKSEFIIGGAISLRGRENTQINVFINPDESVYTTLNGANYATYANMTELPQYNDVCPL